MALDKAAAANFKGEHSAGYNLLVGAINAKQKPEWQARSGHRKFRAELRTRQRRCCVSPMSRGGSGRDFQKRRISSSKRFVCCDVLRSACDPLVGLPVPSLSLGRFVAEVWVVADWGSIEFFPFTDRLTMSEEIERCQSLLTPMPNLSNWDDETNELLKRVDDLAKESALLSKEWDGKSQLSFLSKYLHFCESDAFPIWDSNARLVLGGDDAATWESYKKWVLQVRGEVSKHRECLKRLQTSFESLVRTLDKALYTIGREIMNQMEESSD